jgi:hypothetical protein
MQPIIDSQNLQIQHMKENGHSITMDSPEERFSGTYPDELSEDEIKKIFADSYTHRSEFIHQGKQPPHPSSIGHQIFFQEYYERTETGSKIILLPRFELLSAIAKNSIINWMNQIK